jgi:hypothetical protein
MSAKAETNTFLVGDLVALRLNRPKNVHLHAMQGFPQANHKAGL